jgi:hypothetical protein
MSALPETTAIAETSTNINTDTRTDDLGFGAFEHKIDANPITPGDRTYRRSIFYPVMYWSDTSSNDVGLTLITHGLQGVSGGATRGVMLVRQVTKDPEGLTDPGVHHLTYGYLPHTGTAESAQPWLTAYEFNQPLIAAWKSGGNINIQIPFDNGVSPRQLNNDAASFTLPNTFSLLSTQNAIVSDLYRQDNQLKAIILNYSPMQPATLQISGEQINLPQSVFSVTPISLQSLSLPPTK